MAQGNLQLWKQLLCPNHSQVLIIFVFMQEKSDLKLLSRWCHLVAISVFFLILKGKQTHLPSHRMSVNAVPVGYLSHK